MNPRASLGSRCQLGLLLVCLCPAALDAQAANSLVITNFCRAQEGWSLAWDQDSAPAAFVLQFQDTLQDRVWRVPPRFPFPSGDRSWVEPAQEGATRFYRVFSTSPAVRGHVLSGSYATSYDTATLRWLFGYAGVQIQPQFNVRLHRITYETVTPLGQPTRASGALCVPEIPGAILPLVCYQHGTITQTNKAPSSMDIFTEVGVGVAFATSGYATVVPDYAGLGESPGLHPYHHARSEATACVDMLRAALNYAESISLNFTNRVFLCGYSQGGHATLALLRELEWFHTNEFTVAACAPMAGAYDLSGVTADDFLSNRPQPNPYYFLYLLGAYQSVYGLADGLPELLAPQYRASLPPLLGGNYTGSQINTYMPTNPVAILEPALLEEFKANPRHPLRLALEDNDVYRWTPSAPLRFYHCSGDKDVVLANTQRAVSYLHSAGRTDVQWVDPVPTAGHGDCVQPSLLGAKLWFDSLR